MIYNRELSRLPSKTDLERWDNPSKELKSIYPWIKISIFPGKRNFPDGILLDLGSKKINIFKESGRGVISGYSYIPQLNQFQNAMGVCPFTYIPSLGLMVEQEIIVEGQGASNPNARWKVLGNNIYFTDGGYEINWSFLTSPSYNFKIACKIGKTVDTYVYREKLLKENPLFDKIRGGFDRIRGGVDELFLNNHISQIFPEEFNSSGGDLGETIRTIAREYQPLLTYPGLFSDDTLLH